MQMTAENEGKILKAAIQRYGAQTQMDVCIEEMAELTKALLKYRRAATEGTLDKSHIDNIVEKIADVEIMLDQMQLVFGDASAREIEKLELLAKRLRLE